MNEYKITLTAHYEKTVTVFADSPEQAQEKMKLILFDTDLIRFGDKDFVRGEAAIAKDSEDDCENQVAEIKDCDEDDCSDCAYYCPVCGCCMCDDED